MRYGKLEEGYSYHIYNRGIGGENIFKKEKHYALFLKKYAQYIPPVMDTFAYCLLKNHFHLLVRVKTREEQEQYFEGYLKAIEPNIPKNKNSNISSERKYATFKHLNPSRQVGHLCNSYTQSINADTRFEDKPRKGSLFERPFERKRITSESYYTNAIYYIHRNPQKHGFVEDFREYPHSSYHAFLSKRNTQLRRKEVLDWFGGKEEYFELHNSMREATSEEGWAIEFD